LIRSTKQFSSPDIVSLECGSTRLPTPDGIRMAFKGALSAVRNSYVGLRCILDLDVLTQMFRMFIDAEDVFPHTEHTTCEAATNAAVSSSTTRGGTLNKPIILP
jgi:hypothetical protein